MQQANGKMKGVEEQKMGAVPIFPVINVGVRLVLTQTEGQPQGLPLRNPEPGTRNSFCLPKGLSIIELLIVMAILTILASIGVTTYSGITSKQRVKTAKHVMASVRTAMEMYKTHNGFYPYETGVSTYADLYSVLSPYLSGDYSRYFNTATFNFKTSVIDSANLNVPTRYTITVSAYVSDPSLLTATHKTLEASLNGGIIK